MTLKFLLFTIFCVFSCQTFNEQKDTNYDRSIVPYDLNNPDETVPLPVELEEISGLEYLRDNLMAAIEDESGTIYLINLSGEIEEEIDFGEDGDYEGIAIGTSGNFMVLESDGDIFQVPARGGNYEKFENRLSSKNDAEGLTYDRISEKFLIACKGESLDQDEEGHSVYPYQNGKVSITPELTIRKKSINSRLEERDLKISGFAPSGIAVEPTTGHRFILSHQGKVLVVTDRKGKLLEAVKLSRDLYNQPEGITFMPDGRLLISNEGTFGTANLLIFNKL